MRLMSLPPPPLLPPLAETEEEVGVKAMEARLCARRE